jgi:prolyl 4-hydroxylase
MGDPFVACIGKRLAAIAGAPVDNLEGLQVVRYRPGDEYKPHHDYLGGRPERLTTLLAYLQADGIQDGRCGGSTVFPRLKSNGRPLRVFPKQGSALLWSNVDAQGSVNEATLHAGEPVLCKDKEKIALNAWFQDEPRRSGKKGRARTKRKRESR